MQVNTATAPSDRAVGLLAVASAIAVANAYYIQPLLVEVGGALSISTGLVGILPGLSQIGLACGLAFLLPLGDIISARRLLLTVIPIQIAALVLFATSGSALAVAAASLLVSLFGIAPYILPQILRHPVYAGAYVFGRTADRTRVVDGRARKTTGHSKPRAAWNVLLRDHHPEYISWEQFEANQQLISENAHMQKRTERKSARGGRALLTGLVRCGRCGRTMRVFYGSKSGHSHRYHCRGDDSHVGGWLCIGIGGLRIDRAVATQIVEAVSDHAIEAAIWAADQVARVDDGMRQAIGRELEEARYEASLAARRYEAVDPAKRLVARELESRWNAALERVADLEARITWHDAAASLRPKIDEAVLMSLARDLPATWNAPGTDIRTKQRITHILVREVLLDLDDAANEAVVTIHWTAGAIPSCGCHASAAGATRPGARPVRSRSSASWEGSGRTGRWRAR